MTSSRATIRVFHLGLLLALVAAAPVARAADATDDVTARTQRARNGAGVLVSTWQPDEPTGFLNSETPAFQAYLQKGLDQHLAWENTLGYWQRTSKWSDTQPLVGTTNHELETYLVPTITALRLYPFDLPTTAIEPFVSAGVGPVLGVQQNKTTGGLSPVNETTMHAGLGVRAGAGVVLHASEAFGITAGGHFESASFGTDMVGNKLYQAWGVDLGLAYRFQYR